MDEFDEIDSSPTRSKLSKSDGNDQDCYNPKILREMEKIFKKKVLMEQNEASFPETLNFDQKPSSSEVSLDNSVSQMTMLSSRVSNIDGNKENYLAVGDLSSSRPYDPLTNYLSPRPKFLRYKPNRRLEMFLRRESYRVGEGNSGSDQDTLSDSTDSSTKEEDIEMEKQENPEGSEGEFDENDWELDDEFERDQEEERGWCLRVLKNLLVTMILVFSTLYITSMNTSSRFSLEVLSKASGPGTCPILNHAFELRVGLGIEPVSGIGSTLWDEEVTEAASKSNLDNGRHWEEKKSRCFIEENEILKEEYDEGKTESRSLVEVDDTEQVRKATEEPQSEECSAPEMAVGEKNEAEFLELTVEYDGDQVKVEESEIFDKISVPSEIFEKDQSIETEFIFDGMDQDNLVSDNSTASGNEYKMVDAGDKEVVESNTEEAKNFVASKITKLVSSLGEIAHLKELENVKSESLLKVVVGLSASFVILTCLILSFQFKKERDYTKLPAVSLSLQPLLESPIVEAEKIITLETPRIRPCDKSSPELIENGNSYKILSSSILSKDEEENFKEFHHLAAPTVQFLGEFVVGEVSSSFKNKSGLKNRMIESEDGCLSVTVEEKPVSKAHSGPGTFEKDLSEFSAGSSPSYGSFAIEKKIIKKEMGGDEDMRLITTPVRRSTRIRNRVVSP